MMKKRLFSVLLALIMVLALVPTAAFASDIVDSGTCGTEGDGSNLTWTLDSNGTLTISGTGAMTNYTYSPGATPWSSYCATIRNVTISDGVTAIGAGAFYDCGSLECVSMPDSLLTIGGAAFENCSSLESVTIPEGVTTIGGSAFRNCSGLKEIHYNARAVTDFSYNGYPFSGIGKFSNAKVIVGSKVKKIPAYIFRSYGWTEERQIGEIVFTGNAPIIGDYAFRDRITTAYYPYGNDTWTSSVRKNYYGHVTWMPYSSAKVVSYQCEGKGGYAAGNELDTSSILLTINRADGCVETYTYATGEIKLGAYDMSKSGHQSIDVTCKDVSTKLDIYVHDVAVKTMDAKDYPESSHNYENGLDKTYTYQAHGAYWMDVTFSEKTAVENNVDFIYVDGEKYTGTSLAGQTIHVNRDTLTIRLTSDGRDSDYGFSIDRIVTEGLQHDYANTKVVAPTYTEQGYTEHTCICRDSYKDSYTDMKTLKQPTVTLSATITGIAVKWNKIPGATGYKVYRREDSSTGWKLIKTITSDSTVSYTDANRTNGTKYQYKVCAIAKVGSKIVNQSAFSAVKGKYFVTRPEINAVSNTSTGINLKWSRVPGATGYKIYRKAGSSSTAEWKLIKTVTAGSTISYTDINRTNGTKYQYKIIAVRKVGSTNYLSAYSPVRTMYRLTRPTISSATNSGAGKITLKWNSNSKCSGYQVKYVRGDTIKTVKTTNLSKTLSDLAKGSTYKVYVRSYKTVGDYTYYSAYSGYKSVKITK